MIAKRGNGRNITRFPARTGEPVDPATLLYLMNDTYCDGAQLRNPDGSEHFPTTLYRRSYDSDGEETYQPVTSPPGLPIPHRIWCISGESDRAASEESWVELSWPEVAPGVHYRFKQEDLDSGKCWAKWGGVLNISSRRSKDYYADIVRALARHRLTVERAPRTAGFQMPESQGQPWCYVRPNGWVLTAASSAEAEGLPIHGLTLNDDTRRYWDRLIPTLDPAALTDAALDRLVDLSLQIDPRGRLLAVIGCGMRGLIASLLPIRTGLLAYGSSGAGKTTSVNVGRCCNGLYPYQAVGDVNLGSYSASGPESQAAPYRDGVLMLDDGRRRGEASATGNDDSKLLDLLDQFFTAASDDCELKTRANRDTTHKKGTHVKSFLAVTAEYLPALSESRMRRILVFGYDVGEVNHTLLREVHDELKGLVARGGTAIIRRMLTRLDDLGETAAVSTLAEWEQQQADRLYNDLRRERPTARDEFIRSLAQNYARPLTGIWLLERASLPLAASDDGFMVATLYPYLIQLAMTQLDLIETHAANAISTAWVISATRRALHEKLAHLLDMDEAPLTEDRAGILSDYGYDTGGTDGWIRRGAYLGNLDGDGEYLYLRGSDWCDTLQRMAARDHLRWAWSPQTLPGELVRLGVVEPANDGRAAHRPYIKGIRTRRLALRRETLDMPPDDGGDDEIQNTKVGENSGPSGPSGPDGSPALNNSGDFMGPLPESHGTATQTAVPLSSKQRSHSQARRNTGSQGSGTAGTAGTAKNSIGIGSDTTAPARDTLPLPPDDDTGWPDPSSAPVPNDHDSVSTWNEPIPSTDPVASPVPASTLYAPDPCSSCKQRRKSYRGERTGWVCDICHPLIVQANDGQEAIQ